MTEEASTKDNKQPKKTLDISDIEKSIDNILHQKLKKTTSPKAQTSDHIKPTEKPKPDSTQRVEPSQSEPKKSTIPTQKPLPFQTYEQTPSLPTPTYPKKQATTDKQLSEPHKTPLQQPETKEQHQPKPFTLLQSENQQHQQQTHTPQQPRFTDFTPFKSDKPSIYAIKQKQLSTTSEKPPQTIQSTAIKNRLKIFTKPQKITSKTTTQLKTKKTTTQKQSFFSKINPTKGLRKKPKQETSQPSAIKTFLALKKLKNKIKIDSKTPLPQQTEDKKEQKKSIFNLKSIELPKINIFSKEKTDTKTSEPPQTTSSTTEHHKPSKISQHLDTSVHQLSEDEANWLDQKIQQTDMHKIQQHSKIPTLTPEKNPQDQLFTPISASSSEKKSSLSLLKNSLQKKRERPVKTPVSPLPPTKFHDGFRKKPKTETKPSPLSKIMIKKSAELTDKPETQTKNDVYHILGIQQTPELPELQPTSPQPNLATHSPTPSRRRTTDVHQLKSIILQDLGYSEGSYDELDFYPLMEPFSYVEIIREKKTLDKRYVLVEINLNDDEQQLIQFLRDSLNSINVDAKELEEKGDRTYLKQQIEQIIDDYMLDLDEQTKKKIIFYIEKQYLGLEKLEVLMRDPNIEDISCDGSKVPLFLYHRRFGSLRSNVIFETEEELASFVIKLAQKCGKHISIAEPMLDATMPDGSRIQMTLSTEITTKGSTFTIRKFMEDPFSPPDLIEFNTMSADMVAYMWMAVENGINALIAGGTAAGKTSALNALALFIPSESKIVSIEETREINLPHPNWIPGVSRSGFGEVVGNKVMGEIDLYDLMKAALRQRPEYILVGEIRGREAYVLFQAMATGHTTYSTVHADSAQSLIHRLEGKPINIPRIMLQALDIVCIQVISRVKNKRARRCKQIIEIIDIDPTTKEILTNEVFRWDPVEDKFIYSGKSYVLERIRAEKDLSRDDMAQEVHNRARLLQWMNENNIREFKKVATLIAQYVDNPQEILKKI